MAKELNRASLIKRFASYLIDYLLIAFLAALISYPFTDIKKTEKYEKESSEIMEKFQKQEISAEEYISSYSDVYYKLSKNTGIMTFITIIIEVLYYIVFQLYNKGQTIGKKIMKIKIVSNDGDLGMNQMIFRELISNMILLNIINFALITFTSKNVYTVSSSLFSGVQYIIVLISILLATTKEGRTIHDRIAHTRVISIK